MCTQQLDIYTDITDYMIGGLHGYIAALKQTFASIGFKQHPDFRQYTQNS